MKLVRRSLTLAACAAFSSLQAQQAKRDDAPAKTLAADNKPADAKPGDAAKKPGAKLLTPADIERNKEHTLAVIEVNLSGSTEQILVELFPESAPKTVENFIKNANEGIYKGQAFHRAIKDYLAQVGDPLSKDPTAREKWGLSQEYTIPGEPKLPHVIGSVGMARRSDKVNPKQESDGTQFYFAAGNLSALNGTYTVFGQVVSGLDVVKRISEVPADSNDCPLGRVEIKSIKVITQKGPLVALVKAGKKKRYTRPEALKGPFEKFMDRIW